MGDDASAGADPSAGDAGRAAFPDAPSTHAPDARPHLTVADTPADASPAGEKAGAAAGAEENSNTQEGLHDPGSGGPSRHIDPPTAGGDGASDSRNHLSATSAIDSKDKPYGTEEGPTGAEALARSPSAPRKSSSGNSEHGRPDERQVISVGDSDQSEDDVGAGERRPGRRSWAPSLRHRRGKSPMRETPQSSGMPVSSDSQPRARSLTNPRSDSFAVPNADASAGSPTSSPRHQRRRSGSGGGDGSKDKAPISEALQANGNGSARGLDESDSEDVVDLDTMGPDRKAARKGVLIHHFEYASTYRKMARRRSPATGCACRDAASCECACGRMYEGLPCAP